MTVLLVAGGAQSFCPQAKCCLCHRAIAPRGNALIATLCFPAPLLREPSFTVVSPLFVMIPLMCGVRTKRPCEFELQTPCETSLLCEPKALRENSEPNGLGYSYNTCAEPHRNSLTRPYDIHSTE